MGRRGRRRLAAALILAVAGAVAVVLVLLHGGGPGPGVGPAPEDGAALLPRDPVLLVRVAGLGTEAGPGWRGETPGGALLADPPAPADTPEADLAGLLRRWTGRRDLPVPGAPGEPVPALRLPVDGPAGRLQARELWLAETRDGAHVLVARAALRERVALATGLADLATQAAGGEWRPGPSDAIGDTAVHVVEGPDASSRSIHWALLGPWLVAADDREALDAAVRRALAGGRDVSATAADLRRRGTDGSVAVAWRTGAGRGVAVIPEPGDLLEITAEFRPEPPPGGRVDPGSWRALLPAPVGPAPAHGTGRIPADAWLTMDLPVGLDALARWALANTAAEGPLGFQVAQLEDLVREPDVVVHLFAAVADGLEPGCSGALLAPPAEPVLPLPGAVLSAPGDGALAGAVMARELRDRFDHLEENEDDALVMSTGDGLHRVRLSPRAQAQVGPGVEPTFGGRAGLFAFGTDGDAVRRVLAGSAGPAPPGLGRVLPADTAGHARLAVSPARLADHLPVLAAARLEREAEDEVASEWPDILEEARRTVGGDPSDPEALDRALVEAERTLAARIRTVLARRRTALDRALEPVRRVAWIGVSVERDGDVLRCRLRVLPADDR